MQESFSITTAVTDILQNLAEQATAYVPRLVTALLVLVIGFLIAKIGEVIFRNLLSRAKFDTLMERVGIQESLSKLGVRQPLSRLIPRALFILFMFVFVQSAAREVGLVSVADAITAVFAFLPNLLSALVIVLFGNTLAQFLGGMVTASARGSGVGYAKTLGGLVSGLVLIVVIVIALAQLKVDIRIINILTIVLFSGFTLGFAITFGLGTRDTTRHIIAGFYARKLFRTGETVEVAGARGTLKAVTAIQTILESEGNDVAVPNGRFLDETVRRTRE